MVDLVEQHRCSIRAVTVDPERGTSIPGRCVVGGPAVSGWQVECSCGRWQGVRWQRTPCRADHCPDARCLYSGDGTLSTALRGLVVADWEIHLHRTMTMMPVQLAHDSLLEAQQRLAEAVQFVRGSGASWEDVGAAAGGITGSAAQYAWGAPSVGVRSAVAGQSQ